MVIHVYLLFLVHEKRLTSATKQKKKKNANCHPQKINSEINYKKGVANLFYEMS